MINVYEQVDRNKRVSFLVMVGFTIFVVAIGWFLYRLGSFGPGGMVLAFILAFSGSFIGYWWGDKIILSISQARPADKKEFFNFYTSVENIALSAQIPMPKIYIIDSPAMNAFATGRDIQHAVVCATTGLLAKLDLSEIEAVVAHEISHIRNYDMRLMTIVTVLVGTISILAQWFMRGSIFRSRDDNKEGGQLGMILMIFGFVLIILSPLIAQLIQLAISRRREFLADAGSAMITRFPQGLISALKKLDADSTPLASAAGATENLFIVNPFKGRKGVSWFANLFNTHPPVMERIKALQAML